MQYEIVREFNVNGVQYVPGQPTVTEVELAPFFKEVFASGSLRVKSEKRKAEEVKCDVQ